MMEKTREHIWATWISKQTDDHFQEMLNAQTEDGKYQVLAQLLSKRLEKLKKGAPE
jgi:hypothetical protein